MKVIFAFILLQITIIFPACDDVGKNKNKPNSNAENAVDSMVTNSNTTSAARFGALGYDTLIKLSLCELPKFLIDTPVLNSILVTPLFLNDMQLKSIVDRQLNTKEKEYLHDHKLNSAGGALCAIGAEMHTSGIEGRRNGKADALRHGFWGACMAKILGPEAAQQILDNHEDGNGDQMDAANNKVAVAIGKKLANSSFAEIWAAIQEAYENGELKSNVPPTVHVEPLPPDPIPSSNPSSPASNDGGNRDRARTDASERPRQDVEKPARDHSQDFRDGIADPHDHVPEHSDHEDHDNHDGDVHIGRPSLGFIMNYGQIWTSKSFSQMINPKKTIKAEKASYIVVDNKSLSTCIEEIILKYGQTGGKQFIDSVFKRQIQVLEREDEKQKRIHEQMERGVERRQRRESK